MSMSEAPQPSEMTAEQFARLVRAWDDDGIITEGLRAAGVEQVLERIFGEMCDRLRTEKVRSLDAEVLWLVEVRGEEHAWTLRLHGGSCDAVPERSPDPEVTFRMDLATFARVVTGHGNPVKLVLTRKLRPSGDLLLAMRVPTFFRMPRG